MKPTKKQEREIMQVYDTWMNSYLNGDVKTYDSFLDDGYRFIGSTDNEEFLNRRDTTQFFKDTAEQFSGKTDLRKQTTTIEAFDDLIFITHLFDAWFRNGTDWTYYGRFRFTSVLQEKKEGWKFIYQHFSIADSKTDEGESIGFDKVNEENQELREAIKRRTVELETKNRELEIEGALGRIRAQATAMAESSELLDIVVTMRNEFTHLGHEAGYFWHMMWLPDKYEKAMTSGDGTRIGFVMELPRHIHGKIPLLAKWEKSKKPTVVYAMSAEEAVDYVDKMVALGDFQSIDPQAPTHDDIRHIGGLTFVMARTSHGEIGYSLPGVVKDPPKEDLKILERFAGAFDLAHRRFLDLQKAEKQRREVQIELALEKVRSRTMAMQKSEELSEASFLLDAQVRELGMNTWGCAFNIYGEEESTEWFGNEKGELNTYKVPRIGVFKDYYDKGQQGETLFIREFSGDECVEHYEFMSTLPGIGDILKQLKKSNNGFPTYQIDHVAYFKYGYVLFITREPVPEAYDVFKRFANVFEQTYTRFLDLQKAEAQAREAQIEAVLERVRAQSMAMHTSDELKDVVRVIFDQLSHLNINAEHAGIVVDYEPKKDWHFWVAETRDIPAKITVPNLNLIWDRQFAEAKKNGKKLFTTRLNFEEKNAFYKELLPHIEGLTQEMQDHYFKRDGLAISTALQKDIGLYIENFSGTPYTEEENSILLRFSQVFQQTYTRFLDLKKAEAQAREAQIEFSLERVRSQAMAMRKSEDLVNCTMIVFDELEKLNLSIERSGIGIFNPETKDCQLWTIVINKKSEKELATGVTSLTIHPMLIETFNAWKNQKPFSYILEGKELKEYYNLVTNSKFVLPEELIEKSASLPKEYYHYSPFRAGGLYFFSDTKPFDEEKQIIRRFAEVFDMTYTRFLDLQKAEAQAREAQIEAALERVRSRSMAMHSTSELQEVIKTVHKEFNTLDIAITGGVFIAINEDIKKEINCWGAGGTTNYIECVHVPFLNSPIYTGMIKKIQKGPSFFTEEFSKSQKKKFFEHLFKHPPYSNTSKKHKDEIFDRKGGYTRSCAVSENTSIFMINHHGEKFSETDNEILRRFANVFEQTYTRFLDLQKAEAQAREAQIETALERVRSRSMAMHKSEELLDVITVVSEQLQQLNFKFIHVSFANNDMGQDYKFWTASIGKPKPMRFTTPYMDIAVFNNLREAQKKSIPFCTDILTKEEHNQWHQHLLNHGGSKVFSKEDNEFIMSRGMARSIAINSNIILILANYASIPYSEEENKIIERFGQVFEQSYTRFLDLQKAEAQSRESQIEVALEKVRSRTMAMQKGEEVKDVVVLLYKELIALGVTNFATCGYVEINEETNRQETWVTSPGGDSLGLFYLPLTGDVHFDARYEAWKNKQTVFHQTVAGIERRKHLEYAITTFNSKEAEEMVLTQFPDPTVFYCFNFSHGYLHLVAGSQLNKEEEYLLARFTRVFEQTYARFLDLKKAEAQAREAQIENALEKVRSRSLAMHKPDELQEVITVVAEKLQELGVIFDVGGVILCTYFPDNKDVVHWIASPDLSSSQSYYVPYFDNPIFSESWDSKNRGDAYFSKEFPVEAKNEFFKHAFENSDYRHFPNDYKQHVLEAEKHALSAAWSKNSAIIIPSLTGVVPSESDAEILKRFAKVFEQAYIRFMDLQKAEAQAREAQIEAALEKVRSRTMAMQHSDELPEAANNLFLQVQALGIPTWSAGYCIWNEEKTAATAHMSSEGEIQKPFVLPIIGEGYDFKKPLLKGDSFHVDELGGEALVKHYEFMRTLPIFGEVIDGILAAGFQLPTFQIFHIVYFKFGYVMFITYETVPDAHHIFKRFGQVFEQTYTRFLDLKLKEDQAVKLEEEKRRLEKTLKDLQETQMQLIQSEKMASLGELTAGIAHEIQNPLNFVNNFSEVSVELIEEMHEELEKGDLEEAIAISEDVKQNLEKINHHGNRADGIVKGMLQHSRSSSGRKEPTDINALADEYLRLAYHGLRAKDKSFNATLETDYDDEIAKIEIIPQDIGRVILNLITNAFYVVKEKKEKNSNGFEPTVAVSTKKKGNMVLVTVKDNGNGIPKEVLDKIFQPFFTTKPTGQGTGLGLSMSYDIVTKGHGGELKVETKEGKETTFTIVLPIG